MDERGHDGLRCEEQPTSPRDAFDNDCDMGATCRPYDPEDNGSIADTRCLADDRVRVCRGECNPLEPTSCPPGEACVIGLADPVPRCARDPVEIPIEGCENALCPGLSACIPSQSAFDCSKGSCRMDVCDPSAPACPADSTCIAFAEVGGPDVAVGFCNPP